IKEHVLPRIGEVAFSFLVDFYYRDTAYYEKARWRGTWSREGGGVFVNQAIYTWDTWQWLLGGVDTAYGYWTNLLHPHVEVEDIGYGLVAFKGGAFGKLFATSICEAPEDTVWMRVQGSEGELVSTQPWLYTLDFSLQDKGQEQGLRAQLDSYLAGLTGPGYRDWTNGHDRRVLLQMQDLILAVREGREVSVSPESCGQAMKILGGIHWTGWNHADAFRRWAYLYHDLPQPSGRAPLPTVDDARRRDWRGGDLARRLVSYVQDASPTLAAPFLGR
ncbi:MAG TPA: Gfo/Idh/MocA family oxidoreductase, partial [Chloroflexota bacterium]|nr:Gfo/Idh/MocA family oxidoreductase [Chloroflexota bacterium]